MQSDHETYARIVMLYHTDGYGPYKAACDRFEAKVGPERFAEIREDYEENRIGRAEAAEAYHHDPQR
jgi:hypothetical protein